MFVVRALAPALTCLFLLLACTDDNFGGSVQGAGDAAGSRADENACAPDNAGAVGFAHLLGSLHEHSGYSDGSIATTPASFYAAGAANNLDFMGGSDHSDNAAVPVTANQDCVSADFLDCLQLSPEGLAKWQQTQAMADAASTASFTAIRGYEWTSDRFGHINVFFSQNNINAKTGTGYLASMEDFWTWLSLPAALGGGDDGVAVFNHPGREDTAHNALSSFGAGDPAYAFNDLEYRPEADRQVVGIEMYGKSGDYYDGDNGAPVGGWYAHALDQGWHVAPVGAEDEHGREWAKPSRAKTVLMAPDRSRENLKKAMQAQRFYALAHQYSGLRMSFNVSGLNVAPTPMGSRVASSEPLDFAVTVSGLSNPRLEVVGPGGTILNAANAASLNFSVMPAGAQEAWRYVRAINANTGDVAAVSAPIWFRAGPDYPVCAGG